jgi:hypothetical protein
MSPKTMTYQDIGPSGFANISYFLSYPMIFNVPSTSPSGVGISGLSQRKMDPTIPQDPGTLIPQVLVSLLSFVGKIYR